MDDFPQINSILRQLCRHSITLLRFFGKTALSRTYLTSRYVDGCSRFFCVDSSNLTMRQERRESATPARLKGHNHFAHWITHVNLRITSLRTTSSKNRVSFFVKTRHCRKYKYSIQRTVLLRRIRLTYLHLAARTAWCKKTNESIKYHHLRQISDKAFAYTFLDTASLRLTKCPKKPFPRNAGLTI